MRLLWFAAALSITGTALADEALRREAGALFGELKAPSPAPAGAKEIPANYAPPGKRPEL